MPLQERDAMSVDIPTVSPQQRAGGQYTRARERVGKGSIKINSQLYYY